jgi:(1->4)-alpha-D-glucan 1-alpha-D-glucosylmutase
VQRAALAGVALRYIAFDGEERAVPEDALRRALDAMLSAEKESISANLPPLLVLPVGESLHLRWPAATSEVSGGGCTAHWELRAVDALTDAAIAFGEIEQPEPGWCALQPRVKLPMGYYDITLHPQAGAVEHCRVAIVPPSCWLPPELQAGGRYCGLVVQLYALRSAKNCGIGDFGDLMDLIDVAAANGAAFIGLNPLHALFAEQPARASPYSPSSRLALNPLYLNVGDVIAQSGSSAAQATWRSDEMAQRLQRLRATELVDYPGVAALKHELLNLVWRDFEAKELGTDSARGQAFGEYMKARADRQLKHAVHESLQAHFFADSTVRSWKQWPVGYQDPHGEAVQSFRASHASDIGYRAWLQWLAEQQLERAQAYARQRGMSVGLYRDLAVGVDPNGSETWLHRDLFVHEMRIGAPPDLLHTNGQDWGLAPFNPTRLADVKHKLFIETLRANMQSAGALRMDHVMALMRLYWTSEVGGTYVTYPTRELMGILALESHRQKCIVVGEDLGTVPPQMRALMDEQSMLGCRPLMFECAEDGRVAPPSQWSKTALATFGTHDLPTLRGFWQGVDLSPPAMAEGELTQDIAEDAAQSSLRRRRQVCAGLLRALVAEGLLREDEEHTLARFTGAPPPALVQAVHAFIASTPCMMIGVALEDVTGQLMAVNKPGTTEEQAPNWRRKIAVGLDRLSTESELTGVLAAIIRAGTDANGRLHTDYAV